MNYNNESVSTERVFPSTGAEPHACNACHTYCIGSDIVRIVVESGSRETSLKHLNQLYSKPGTYE